MTCIPLLELDENDAQFSFKIEFHGIGNRSYVLCADSQEAMEQWMKSLACASYDYMKLMVTELQRQLKGTLLFSLLFRRYDVSSNDLSSIQLVGSLQSQKEIHEVDLLLCSECISESCAIPYFMYFPSISFSITETREKEKKSLDNKTMANSVTVEDCDTGASFISFVDNNYEIDRSKSASHLTPTSSPHPPPRSRQNGHNKIVNSQSQSNYATSRSKSSHNVGPSAQMNSTSTYGNLRNKISFKDVHTGFGRPVLRDRNVWRYEKKSDNSLEIVPNTTEPRPVIPEQNLLISL